MVKIRLLFFFWGINGIRKIVKRNGVFGYEEMEGSKKVKF